MVAARGTRLFESQDQGGSWSRIVELPFNFSERIFACARILSRLLRRGVHHFCPGSDYSLVFSGRSVYRLEENKACTSWPVNGSRPIAVCHANNAFYYGEYRSNPERSPVHVWNLNEEDEWQPAWRFENIRHVHGVFHDPYENSIWVTTGDLDHEAGIWRTYDGFKTLEKVAGDSQQFRAVQLLFTEDFVYFCSDAPDENNFIYHMGRSGKNIEQLAAVGSSVFYGCKVGRNLFFSTAVEPSGVNKTRFSEVLGSSDGLTWKVVIRFKKDFWPMKYFQYGQVLFPSGPGDGKHLWITPMSTQYDQKSFKIPIESIFEQ